MHYYNILKLIERVGFIDIGCPIHNDNSLFLTNDYSGLSRTIYKYYNPLANNKCVVLK